MNNIWNRIALSTRGKQVAALFSDFEGFVGVRNIRFLRLAQAMPKENGSVGTIEHAEYQFFSSQKPQTAGGCTHLIKGFDPVPSHPVTHHAQGDRLPRMYEGRLTGCGVIRSDHNQYVVPRL